MKPNARGAGRSNSLASLRGGDSLLRCMTNGPIETAIARFRAQAALPPDSQRVIDDAVVRTGRSGLVIVRDLMDAGLVRPLPNWLSVMELGYRRTNDVGHAQRTMVPKARGERQVADQDQVFIPIYCTWDDFSFNIRELAAAERVGQPLDTTHVEMATRRDNESFEDQAIYGAGFNVNGNSAPGFLTDPANRIAYTDGEAWTATGHSGEDIYADVMKLAQPLIDANFTSGQLRLYVPTNYGLKLGEDWKANSSLTIRQRLEELEFGGGQRLTIKTAPSLPANRTLLLHMTSDVVDVILGQEPTTVSWEDGPGWEKFFSVLGCLIVRIKENYEGEQGFVVGDLTL